MCGSDIRLANFDVHFRSFEIIWDIFKDADDNIKRGLLAICMADSMYFYKKSIGTKYEESIKNQMYNGWAGYFSILGNSAFKQSWFKDFLVIIEDREKKMGRKDNC